METRTISARPDIAVATTSPRLTPTPPRASRFGEVLSNTVVRSAESAMRLLPGSPVMAVAVRGATGGAGSLNVPMSVSGVGRGPEGPLASSARVGTPNLAGVGGVGGTGLGGAGGVNPSSTMGTGATGEGAGLEASLQQSQDMNLYYLQVQETVNAQNRQFTTLSNLLKAQHDTVKTAIGNIR
jgi:hypothetical protein